MCLLCVSCVCTNSSVSCLFGCSACVSSISSDIPLSPESPSCVQREGGIEGRERETLCVCVNVCVCYVLVVCVQTDRYLVLLVARLVSHRYHPIGRCLPHHPPTYRESEGERGGEIVYTHTHTERERESEKERRERERGETERREIYIDERGER
jgi:hypothetical protein